MKYDLIIIGAGPAGLTAAIYALRYKLEVLVIGKLIGGAASEAYKVCNFPSYEKIKGFELVEKIVYQTKMLGIEIKTSEVYKINKNKEEFEVITSDGKYLSKKIIIATGLTKNKLDIEKEGEFIGRGVSYCASCDAPLYKGKISAVIGGSDSALTTALLLTKFAKKVYIIYRREKFTTAEPIWREDVLKNKKIKVMFNSEIKELIGKDYLKAIKIKIEDKDKELKVDGLFVEIGSTPNDFLAKELKLKMDENYIHVDKKQSTSIKGVYAAGDVTNNPLKQIITACSEGAIAAYSVYKEILSE